MNSDRIYNRLGWGDARKMEHVLIAERALGKPLPKRAVVHHVNGNGKDNRHKNLVVCQNQAYHMLLHKRARALREGGDVHARRCSHCGGWGVASDPKFYFSPTKYETAYHRACRKKYDRKRYLKGRRDAA